MSRLRADIHHHPGARLRPGVWYSLRRGDCEANLHPDPLTHSRRSRQEAQWDDRAWQGRLAKRARRRWCVSLPRSSRPLAGSDADTLICSRFPFPHALRHRISGP